MRDQTLRRGSRLALPLWAITACCCLAAPARTVAATPSKTTVASQSEGSVYIEQIRAPTDWRVNARFWAGADTLIPTRFLPDRTGALSQSIVVGTGNSLSQTGTGVRHVRFAVQWGDRNVGTQRQSGAGHRAELVQISPGASVGGKANAGKGNGPEFDIFGYEVDPGRSGVHNNAPEPGAGSGRSPGTGNTGLQVQAGEANEARLVQIGWENTGAQQQSGRYNEAESVQLGQRNATSITQSGADNDALTIQIGLSNVALTSQSSFHNRAIIIQTGLNNQAVIRQ